MPDPPDVFYAKLKTMLDQARSRPDFADQTAFANKIYMPDPRLAGKIKELRDLLAKDASTIEAGKLLEQIAYLSFKGLEGCTIDSFFSSTAQYDLVVDGTSPAWHVFLNLLAIENTTPVVIVECKARGHPFSDHEMSRLCDILETNHRDRCRLAVAFAWAGLSGVKRGKKSKAVRDARLRQMLYHSRTSKYVVVLDRNDLDHLLVPGGFVELLRARAASIETAAVRAPEEVKLSKCDLPKHLAELV